MSSSIIKPTWALMEALAEQLAAKIITSHKRVPFQHIVAISRGGLIPLGLLLQHIKFGEAQFHILKASSYIDSIQRQLQVTGLEELDVLARTLVIDDITDTGATFNTIKKVSSRISCAAFYAKPMGEIECDFYVEFVPQDTWVSFPWELDDTKAHV